MKKLLIIALLVGCGAGSTPPATTIPDAPPLVPMEETNQYEGVVSFLHDVIDMDRDQFAELCSVVGGSLDNSTTTEYVTCMDGNAGFAIKNVNGATMGASILVPSEEGQELANALVVEIGLPTANTAGAVMWESPGFVLVFAPISTVGWILVLERTGTAL